MRELSEAEYLETMVAPMRDVTADPGEAIDIWPYVKLIADEVGIPAEVIENEWVEHVYRGADEAFDHVLIPMGQDDLFLVLMVCRKEWAVYGHYELDLREKYGVEKV